MSKKNPYTGVEDPEVAQVGDGEAVKTAIPVDRDDPEDFEVSEQGVEDALSTRHQRKSQ